MREYGAEIEIWEHPRWSKEGGYSGKPRWKLEAVHLPVEIFVDMLRSLIKDIESGKGADYLQKNIEVRGGHYYVSDEIKKALRP